MSRNRQNNHYHYAEQFSDRRRCRAKKSALLIPRRAIWFAVMMMLVFGVITATFAANYSEPDTARDDGALIVKVRNAKIAQDYIADGMDREEALALTGASIDNSSVIAARPDLAGTGAYSDFYIVGDDMGWSFNSPGNKMTLSDGGYYYYKQITGNGSDRLFRLKLSNSWSSANVSFSYHTTANDHWNVNDIGHGTDSNYWMWDPNNSDGNMAYKANSGKTMYLLYYPDGTPLNTSGDGIVCAAKSLPDDTVTVKLGHHFDSTTTWGEVAMTNSNGTWSCSKAIDGNLTRDFTIEEVYGDHTTIHYKDQNEETMTYDHCTDWQFETNNKGNPKLATVITGSYTFSYVFANKKLSVTYPSYTVTTSVGTDVNTTTNTASPATTTVAIGGSVQITATTTDAKYNFDKWTVTSGAATTGSYGGTAIDGNNSNITSTSLTIYPSGTSATVNLQANYKIKTFTITYKSDTTPATASAGTISNPATNGVPATQTKQYNVDISLTDHVYNRPHYTQVGWATTANYTSQSSSGGTTYYALGANYSPNSNLTLYPVWKLNTPSYSNTSSNAPGIIASGSMTVGSTPVNLGLHVSDYSADATRSYSYSWTGGSGTSGATVSVGTDPSDTDTFMKFTADTPGTYTVTVTVTDTSNTGVINTKNAQNKGYASATSTSATITVQPDAPDFLIYAYNIFPDGERDGTTAETAYKIQLGNRYYFSAQVINPIAGYTYQWSQDTSFTNIVATGTSFQFTNEITATTPSRVYTITQITYDPSNPPANDPRTLADESHGLEQVTLYCRAIYYSVSKDSDDKHLFYFIQPLIESFKYEPMQKIFNMNDQTVSLAAEYNFNNNPDYTTKLYFSDSNDNPWTEAISASGFITDFTNAIRAYLYPAGPKYFFIEITGLNSQNELITSVSDKIHTTVGTADSTAYRTLYFDNSTGVDLKNQLVMCYYIDGYGELRYQTAQDLYKSSENNAGLHYRVMLPEDASVVRFGFLARDVDRVRYYGSPSIDGNGVIVGFSVPIYFGYTNQITLSDSVRRINATSSTTVSSMQSFTCTTSGY